MAVTIAASVMLIGLFWGFSWLGHWDKLFFTTSSEDYIKDLYTTTYHAAYDEEATMCRAMNYPYGEYHTFTGMQPIVAMPLQALRKAGVEHTERAVLPLMNLMVLLSIVLCAVFLYLLFYELKLPMWYSIAAALLVTLMSPQLQRMGGHISLSYYCAVPMLLYFTMRHIRSGGWGWSLSIGISALFFGLCHPYYLIFFATMTAMECAHLFFTRKNTNRSVWDILLAVALQLVLPMVAFFLLTNIGLDEGNRTAMPTGLHTYTARLVGLFVPYGRIYFLNDSLLFRPVQWEARCYVGPVAVAVTVALLSGILRSAIKGRWRHVLHPTDNSALNIMLLTALLLVVFACGVPLDMLPRKTPLYLGPLAQIRALGRLSWMFYYVINIVAFYLVYRWWKRSKWRWRNAVMIVVLLSSTAEAVAYNYRNKQWYTSSWDAWTDYDNRLPENQWAVDFDASKYQAILTLPVFNVGSEYVYMPSQDNMFKQSAYLSIKTGLPLVCNESSRSDIEQAWNSLALTRTAWQSFGLADALPDSRPLLLAVSRNGAGLTDTESRLLSLATPLMNLEDIDLYTLECDALNTVVRQTQDSLRHAYQNADSNAPNTLITEPVFGKLHKWTTLCDMPVDYTGEVEFSFWMDNLLTDQYSHTILHICAFGPDGEKNELRKQSIEDMIDIIDRNTLNGLVRLNIELPEGTTRIFAEIRNAYVKPTLFTVRRILLRPTSTQAAFFDGGPYLNNTPVPDEDANSYVCIEGGRFSVDGKPWFPLMLNYKAFIDGDEVVPAPWYTDGGIREHFDTIASWGFNSVRVCLDVMSEGGDTATMFQATRRMVQQADSAGLRVMLLIKPPFDGYWYDYAAGLMRRLADLPALWAYDLMNEPLYFDPKSNRTKDEAVMTVHKWRKLVRQNAPHHLFTVATAEPIEVFEWDPSMLPVDFIEMHTYHPLRVQAEMWWYSHYCHKPWMVGETGLPADGEQVSYEVQQRFMEQTYRYARAMGAVGYGWWEFQDHPDGVNFEAQYTGLRDVSGHNKPAARLVRQLTSFETDTPPLLPPANYYNMLAYENLAVTGRIVDKRGKPIEGAVVRGWNDDWSVGINTYSDSEGRFRLVSNDICTHFQVSAPGYSMVKFNKNLPYPSGISLPNRKREYQQLPVVGWGDTDSPLPTKATEAIAASHAVGASLGDISLKKIAP
ncbi:MAG: cellulase family glycosylhydrolase [Bacteroidales bacterium]|nr:cellulase family glycosylhydrolase [Bacteroidales bacterium]